MANINDLLRDHVSLEVECIDRLYLNGYVSKLQTGGSLVRFLTDHLGQPIPSPVLLGQMTQRFVRAVKEFAQRKGIPIVKFKHDDRKDDIANEIRRKRRVRGGVVFIGVAQERAIAFVGHRNKTKGYVGFEYRRDKTVYVNSYYFYLDDEGFGPAFIKVCSYAPWGIKVCLNGHEWAKRQLTKRGIRFEALDNGFVSCENPQALQKACDALGPGDIERFFRRWLSRLPLPLDRNAMRAGYSWRLSIWQMEVSLTQVFDRPLRGREFFEEVIRDNVDLGRPDRVQLLFDRKITKKTPGRFRTRVIHRGVHPSLHIEYKKFQLKQYFKEGRALRTESTFNDPRDFGVKKSLSNFGYLQTLGRHINRRLLDVQRVSHNCGLSGESVERVVQPSVTEDGQRAPGLKFGDRRVMALFVVLTSFSHLLHGFRNRELRAWVADLPGADPNLYSAGRMTYDLRRLRLKGIIFRTKGANRYILTPYGWKVARLFARMEARVFRPAMAAFTDEQTPWPASLVTALKKVDAQLDALIFDGIPASQRAA
jgi:hypothetical protein